METCFSKNLKINFKFSTITSGDYRSYENLSKNFFQKNLFDLLKIFLSYFKRQYKLEYENIKLDQTPHFLRLDDIGFIRM